MGLFNLFGGKKKEEAGSASRGADKSPHPGKRTEAQQAKAAAPAAASRAAAPVVAMTTEFGSGAGEAASEAGGVAAGRRARGCVQGGEGPG